MGQEGGAGDTRPCHSAHFACSEPHWAVTVTEGIGPLEVITQVRARGDNVRYAILAPVAPVLFTIDEGEQGSGDPQGCPAPVPSVRPWLLLQ